MALAATLCALLAGEPLPAGSPKGTQAPTAQLGGEARIRHALNRLTFGPRPGDVAAVQAIGLDRWFERQLNPASIDDSMLETRLAEYPAMQLTTGELQRKYPGPAELRALDSRKLPLPSDPAQRALVLDQITFYRMQQRAKETASPATMSGADANASIQEPSSSPAIRDAASAPELQAQSQAELKTLLNLPPNQRLQAILALSPSDLVQMRQLLSGPSIEQLTAGMTPDQKEILAALPGGLRMVALEDTETRLLRDLYSERQLEAVMTDFWLNHFNIYLRKNQNEPYLIPAYERETIRCHALGKFEDLLVATAQSPAMLVYLDNFRSVGPHSEQATRVAKRLAFHPAAQGLKQASAGLNENYGRELMELHTLGVNGGYTQADVTEVAKVFTGWGLDDPRQGASFAFDQRRHEPGTKVVLGQKIPEGGEREGLEVLHLLATSPATAHFLCEQLALRFVSDDPPAALVDRMANSFLESQGDIKTVLRTMFHSPEFWSPSVERAKVKTPEEFVLSAVRSSGAEIRNPRALVAALGKLGMPLYGMQTPNGYSWKQDDWVSTGALVSRMNFALALSTGRIPGVRADWPQLLGSAGPEVRPTAYVAGSESAQALEERQLENLLLGASVSDRTRATVLGQADEASVVAPARDDTKAALMAGLLLGSPEFQRR